MSFGEIMSMYERDEIIINPSFQRLFRWSDYQKSRFIETILLGIPIPPIFVAEDKEGRWELVDGLQRLSTVLSFFGVLKTMPERNNWEMLEGDLITGSDGRKSSDLPMKFQLNIKRSTCRIEIIRWNSKYDMRFELFNRLNTGGSPLTNMEIRNCIYRGTSSKFNEFIKKLAVNKTFIKLVSPSRAQREELYLEELVLRFISLYKNRKNIKRSIDHHMTYFMKDAVVDNKFKYDAIEKVFSDTLIILEKLGSKIFRSKGNDFSTGFYDIIMVGVAENIYNIKRMTVEELEDKINTGIKLNEKVRKKSGRGANSKERVIYRFKVANEVFGK